MRLCLSTFVFRLLVVCVAAIISLPTTIVAQETSTDMAATEAVSAETGATDMTDGAFSIGGLFSDEDQEFLLDLLVPVNVNASDAGTCFWFLNPRASFVEGDEQEMNLGLGYRHLLPNHNVIMGANIFYDSRWTEYDNQFNQLGLGVEVLTEWVDARFNYYLPEDCEKKADEYGATEVNTQVRSDYGAPYAEVNAIKQEETITRTTITTTRIFERYEQAMEGFDCELGVKLPMLPDWMETRLFGGYYDFDRPYGGSVDGFKGRLEIRTLPALTLDAIYYDDEDFRDAEFFAGARLHLPFDMAMIAQGRNPFEGSSESFRKTARTFESRLAEMVIRDSRVLTDLSEFAENEARRIEQRTSSGKTVTHTLADDVTFVNNANKGAEDGTAENPYDTIQEGVDNLFGDANLFVFAGDDIYRETVRVWRNATIVGQGAPIGLGGETLGEGRYPRVWGGGHDFAAFEIAIKGGGEQYVTIAGFDITSRCYCGARGPGIAAYGFRGELELAYNTIHDVTDGIYIENGIMASGAAWIHDNFIENCDGDGILVENGQGFFAVYNNHIRNVVDDGIDFEFWNVGPTEVQIYNNLIEGSMEDPIDIDVYGVRGAVLQIVDNRIDLNYRGYYGEHDGIELDFGYDTVADVTIAGNSIRGLNADGIDIEVEHAADVTARITGNSIEINRSNDASDTALEIGTYDVGKLDLLIADNDIRGGLYGIVMDVLHGSRMDARVLNNKVMFSEDDGMSTDIADGATGVFVVKGNQVYYPGDDGIDFDIYGSGWAAAWIVDNRVVGARDAGVSIDTEDGGWFQTRILGNRVEQNKGSGIDLFAMHGSALLAEVSGNTALDNNQTHNLGGIQAEAIHGAWLGLRANDNVSDNGYFLRRQDAALFQLEPPMGNSGTWNQNGEITLVPAGSVPTP